MSTASFVIQHSSAASQWAKSEASGFFRFIVHPSYRGLGAGDSQWALRALYLSLMVIVLLLPVAYAISSLQELFGIEERSLGNIDIPKLLLIVVLVPLIEEVLFRAGLKNPFWSLAVAPLVTMMILINSGQGLILFMLLMFAMLSITFVYQKSFFGNSQMQLKRLHSRKFQMVFWANCTYFSWAHLSNFDLSGSQIWLCWLVVFPQLVMGALLGYLRLRDGIKSSILSHATINLIGVSGFVMEKLT